MVCTDIVTVQSKSTSSSPHTSAAASSSSAAAVSSAASSGGIAWPARVFWASPAAVAFSSQMPGYKKGGLICLPMYLWIFFVILSMIFFCSGMFVEYFVDKQYAFVPRADLCVFDESSASNSTSFASSGTAKVSKKLTSMLQAARTEIEEIESTVDVSV